MIVVDTSVWIDAFAGRRALPHVQALLSLIEKDRQVGLTDVVLTEVLQGLRSKSEVKRLDATLSAHEILRLDGLDDFRRAAELYRRCRTVGVTIRRSADCLIASVCIREQVPLLHADADFDRLARHTELRVLSGP